MNRTGRTAFPLSRLWFGTPKPGHALVVLLIAGLSGFSTFTQAQTSPIPAEEAPTGDAADENSPRLFADVRIEDANLEIGEPAAFLITFPREAAAERLRIRPPSEQTGELLIDESGAEQLSPTTWRVPFRPLRSGEKQYGPFDVSLIDPSSRTDFQTLAVAATVPSPAAERGEPEDYTNVLKAPPNFVRMILLGLLVLAAVALLSALVTWFVMKRRKAEKTYSPEPRLEPLAEAQLALSRLVSMDYFLSQGTKAHYSELSFLLRRYFERQYRFPAQEMSDDELVDLIRLRYPDRGEALRLVDAFARASLAKFAKWEAPRETAQEDVTRADRFLEGEAERERLAQRRQTVAQREGEAA